MEPIIIIAFLSICIVGMFRSTWTFALILLIFPVEQVIQGYCPNFRSSSLGTSGINYAVGLTAIVSLIRTVLKNPESRFKYWMNTSMIATISLYAWSAISLAWSPGIEYGLETTTTGFPYFCLFILIAPLLINDIEELKDAIIVLLWIGLISGFLIVMGTEFIVNRNARVGFEVTNGIQSNPLAIGELGGLLVILGATLNKSIMPSIILLMRILAVVIGSTVVLKSGSRGEFLIALIIAVTFIPISTTIRSISGFIIAAISIGAFLLVVSYLFSTQTEGFLASKRFTGEELLYGASSVNSRLSNIYTLASAWLQNPIFMIIGLGSSAFSSMPEGASIKYSHSIFADAIFELGIPGLIFMIIIIWCGFDSSYQLLKLYKLDSQKRCIIASLIALTAAQMLLINKQGSLGGIPVFFTQVIVITRIFLNQKNVEHEYNSEINEQATTQST